MFEVEVHVMDIISTIDLTYPKQIIQYFIWNSKLWAQWYQDHMVYNISSSMKMLKLQTQFDPS